MIEAARFLTLFAATGYAAWRSWRHPFFFIYFAANLFYEIASEWPLLTGGDTSAAYHWVYDICTASWLLAALGIVWEAILPYTYRLRRFSLSVLTTMIVARDIYFHMHRPMAFKDWAVFIEATILFCLGFTLGCVSFFSGKRLDAYFLLAVFWILLAAFFWAWLEGRPEAVWVEAGWIVPTAFCVVAFLAVGVKMRREHGC